MTDSIRLAYQPQSVLPGRGFGQIWIGDAIRNTGWWCVSGNINFAVIERPSRWRRFWVRLVVGWVWIEDEKA